MDAESIRSSDDDLGEGGLNPYNGDRACGWAVTWNDDPRCFYVPTRHRDAAWNKVPLEAAARWLRDCVTRADSWVNHNVKFDAHFAHVEGATFDCELHDTMVLSKIVHSDRMSHALKTVIQQDLGIKQHSEDVVAQWLAGYKLPRNKKAGDYALVPADILGAYACDDVRHNRMLYDALLRKMHPQLAETWEMEKLLTPVLWDMEVEGLRVDERQLKVENLKSMARMVKWAETLSELSGVEFTNSNDWCCDVLLTRLGLPVVELTDTGGASFNKDALAKYLGHALVVTDPKRKKIVELLARYRKEQTYRSLFVESFLEKLDDRGYVHPSYNQVIRTGRMSSKNPNSQQMSKRAKQLIHVDEGCWFWCADAAQIEFRLIVHYIKDWKTIEEYEKNPRLDFHSWAARLCEVKRDPAKTINFAMGYGAGRRKVLQQIETNADIMAAVQEEVEDLPEEQRAAAYASRVQQRARQIYDTYHRTFPGIRRTSRNTAAKCRSRGYIFNMYGRHRILPSKAAHNAFNTLCQGGAMDFIKRRMIELAPRYNAKTRSFGARCKLNVHDEVGYSVSPEVAVSPEWNDHALGILEAPDDKLRVPIVWDAEVHDDVWGGSPVEF